jgi:hypothetical protein
MEVCIVKPLNATEQLGAMQRMFLPASEMSDTLRKNACSFWDNQDKILDAMQVFVDGWFERRHAGTHAALEAAQRMCKAETPVDMLREYQDWAGGAFQRLMADGLACQQQCMAVFGAVAPPLAPLGSEQAGGSQAESRATTHTRVA